MGASISIHADEYKPKSRIVTTTSNPPYIEFRIEGEHAEASFFFRNSENALTIAAELQKAAAELARYEVLVR